MLTILYTCIRARMYTTWISQTLSTQTVTDRTVSTVTNTCSTLLQANNGSTCASWTPTEHTFIKSQSQQRISHIPVNVQSACTQFAINLLFVTQLYLQSTCTQFATNLLFVTQFYLQSTCTQFAIHLLTCDSTLFAIYLHYNLQSTCSFVTQFYLRSTRLQLPIELALSKSTSTGTQIACNLQSICS